MHPAKRADRHLKGRGAHGAPRPPSCPPGCRLCARIQGPVGPKTQPWPGSIASATRSRSPRNFTRGLRELRSLDGHLDFAVGRVPGFSSSEAGFDATGASAPVDLRGGTEKRQRHRRRQRSLRGSQHQAPATQLVEHTNMLISRSGARCHQPMGGRTRCRVCFISDGSVFSSAGVANPTLTIVARVLRQADYISRELAAGRF
jgi:hypothetical protein